MADRTKAISLDLHGMPLAGINGGRNFSALRLGGSTVTGAKGYPDVVLIPAKRPTPPWKFSRRVLRTSVGILRRYHQLSVGPLSLVGLGIRKTVNVSPVHQERPESSSYPVRC